MIIYLLLFLGFATFATAPQMVLADISVVESKPQFVAGELLVKFKDNRSGTSNNTTSGTNSPEKVSTLAFQSIIKRKTIKYKVKQRKVFAGLGVEHWKLDKSVNLQTTIEQLKTDPDVLLVEPNYRRYPRGPLDYLVSGIRAKQLSDAALAQVKLDQLRNIISSPPVIDPIVAILDSGFDIYHPEFAGKIFQPYNALDKDLDPTSHRCIDSVSGQVVEEIHGTMVMGVLAAGIDNGTGFNGATESRQIMPIRLGCNYTVAAEVEAIEWAKANHANIINMSWGGPQFSAFEHLALADLSSNNILVVTAAGNEHMNNDHIPDYPSGLNLPNIIAVAAIDPDNRLSNWSQFGQTSVDVAAPGGDFSIGTTAPTSVLPKEPYLMTGGTSFSAPLVSGVAASLLARHPDASIFDVKGAIMGSVVAFSDSLKARLATDGIVDAVAAHDLLSGIAKPVLVVKRVTIDDSTGNNNHKVDAGESIELIVTLENIWADANTLNMTLRSNDLGIAPVSASVDSGLKGYDAATNSYGKIEQRFPVDFGNRTQSQGILFTLDISGEYAAGTPFQYQRSFTIDTGSLVSGEAIRTTLMTHNQDDIHYYHFYTDKRQGELTFNLKMLGSETANNLNLIVSFEALPQFDFYSYESKEIGSVDRGTLIKVSVNGGVQPETITIKDAAAGTYHIAVVRGYYTSAQNIEYSLGVNATDIKLSRAAVSGCVMGRSNSLTKIDPMLPLLVLISLIMIRQRYKRNFSHYST